MNFEFKTVEGSNPPPFNTLEHNIYINGVKVGIIGHSTNRVTFIVHKDGKKFKNAYPAYSWMWIEINKKFDSLNCTKTWLTKNFSELSAKYPFVTYTT